MPRTTASTGAETAPHESYPLKTVSRLTGLSADIIRAWERRYAVVAPLRGPRGARLYSSADVAKLRQLGALVRGGRSIGDVAGLAPDALSALAQNSGEDRRDDGREDRRDVAAGPAQAPIDAVLAALARFDSRTVENLLGESLMGLGGRRFVREVGAPLLERIGTLWETGGISVAEEHLASAAIRNLLGGMMRIQSSSRPPSVLLTAPSGERHELGLSMVALLCLQAGLGIAYTGTDLPADEIAAAARRTGVAVVGLAVVSSENRSSAVEQIRRVEAALPPGVELWLGGRDAASAAAGLGPTRALVLQAIDDVEREIARIASRDPGASDRPRP